MAEPDDSGLFDDLTAFFSAAKNDDPDAIDKAAADVSKRDEQPPRRSKTTTAKPAAKPEAASDAASQPKFVAIEPEDLRPKEEEPFVLIPANVHFFLPWWIWAVIGLALLALIGGILLMPRAELNQMTARLGDNNSSSVQSAMRQLILRGDAKTIEKLYETAASPKNPMDMRLHAVDTLSLIEDNDAARMLLRLELAGSTTPQVRDAAIAARKQREAAQQASGKP